jgi:cytochrome c biogenesis protein CcmG, thiol:disulfide interchange protein DsbE
MSEASGVGRLLHRPHSIILGGAVAALVVIGVLMATVAASGSPPRPLAKAKPFSLARLGAAGQHVSLAGYAGRPVIVNFFASWCPPCKRETPLLERFYAEHGGRVLVVGVDSNDQTANALKFVAADHVTYPVGADPFPANVAVSYGVLGLPQTFFLNAQHRIVRHVVGDVTASELSAWAAQVGR